MDPITLGLLGSSALSAGGSLFGGMMGAAGAAQTNAQQIAANQQMQQFSQNFSAAQGDISRDYNTVAARDARDFAAHQQEIAQGFNADQAFKAMQFNAAEAEKNRSYQTEMANTAWQRGIADMKKAGINPILAASLGGASAPSGSMASGSGASSHGASGPSASSSGAGGTAGGTGSLQNPGEHVSRALSSAAQIGSQFMTLKGQQQNIEESKARQGQADSQAGLNKANESYAKSNEVLNNVLQDKAKQDTATSAAQARAADASAASHMSDAAYRAAQTQTEGHNAVSAYHTSRIRAQEATNAEQTGPSPLGNIIASGRRLLGGVTDKAPPVKPSLPGSAILNHVIRTWNNRTTSPEPVYQVNPNY